MYAFIFFVLFFFFFSSRRRHTRWNCDWSSDVCSSDLAGPQEQRPADRLLDGLDVVRHSGLRQPQRLGRPGDAAGPRSEEHTSELQSQFHLVCRLLLEKKKKKKNTTEHRSRRKKTKRVC